MAAEALVGRHHAPVFDTVRTLHHQRKRRSGGYAARVAQQRSHVHGFATAIDAALGIDKRVKSGRHLPAGHAAIGKIKGGRFQAEERIVGSPRASPASKCTKPSLSVDFTADNSLLRATSRTSTEPSGSALASE
jgi:hypothetical protein